MRPQNQVTGSELPIKFYQLFEIQITKYQSVLAAKTAPVKGQIYNELIHV